MGNIIGTWYINIPRSQKERCSINNVVWFQRLGYFFGYLEIIRCIFISCLDFAVALTRKISCEVILEEYSISHQLLAFLVGHLLERFSIENFGPPLWILKITEIISCNLFKGLCQYLNQKTKFNYRPFR